jgi:hypothetical protein
VVTSSNCSSGTAWHRARAAKTTLMTVRWRRASSGR